MGRPVFFAIFFASSNSGLTFTTLPLSFLAIFILALPLKEDISMSISTTSRLRRNLLYDFRVLIPSVPVSSIRIFDSFVSSSFFVIMVIINPGLFFFVTVGIIWTKAAPACSPGPRRKRRRHLFPGPSRIPHLLLLWSPIPSQG